MKKLLLAVLLLIVGFKSNSATAQGALQDASNTPVTRASVRDTLIVKILALKVRALLTSEFINEVVKNHSSNFGGLEFNFNQGYYSLRSQCYQSTFGDCGNDLYYQLRTVVVAKMKTEIHQGETLMEVYKDSRQKLLETFSQLSPEFRTSLQSFVRNAIEAFTLVEDKDYRSGLASFVEAKRMWAYGNDLTTIDKMLAANRSAEDIAKEIQSLSSLGATDKSFPAPADLELSQFALRRFNEGGDALVQKYLALLTVIQKDLAM